jgi:hypothetical protein
MMARITLLILAFTTMGLTAVAQKGADKKNMEQTFTGKILLKPWSKSSESYCAQGSDYYVLEQKKGFNIVIKENPEMDIAKFAGKNVVIKGKIETKEIKPSSNPMEQRPTSFGGSDTFICNVLVISSIKAK